MSQQRYRLIHQCSMPNSISFKKSFTSRQGEETMLNSTKPLLQRGLGFGGTTTFNTLGDSSYKLESGTRESSIGKRAFITYQSVMVLILNFHNIFRF